MKIRVIEKATGIEYLAEAIEGGYKLFTLEGEPYKKLKDSTLKRNFKKAGTQEDANPENEDNAEDKASKSQSESKSDKTAQNIEISDEKREKMIDKIKKILALAENNPSMEEGLSAALQAQKLMAKYNIHEDEVTLEEIKDEICSVFSQQKHNSQLHSWRKPLANVIARNFRCKSYIKGLDIVFRGYKQDAEIALQVYTSLYTIGNSLGSKLYNHKIATTGSGKGVYNSFVTGFLKGVEEGLNAQCTALMIIVPKEVEEEFKQFTAGWKTTSTKMSISDLDVYNKGKEEGKAAVKARALEKKGGKN